MTLNPGARSRRSPEKSQHLDTKRLVQGTHACAALASSTLLLQCAAPIPADEPPRSVETAPVERNSSGSPVDGLGASSVTVTPGLSEGPPRRNGTSGHDSPRIEFVTRQTKGRFNSYVTYPLVRYREAAVSSRVSARLRRFAEDLERGFERDLRDASHDTPYRSFLVVSCSIHFASSDVVSLGCDNYLFDGGAHGQKSFAALTFLTPGMEELRVEDILRTDAVAQQELLRLCNVALIEQAERESPREEAVQLEQHVTPVHLRTFTVTPEGLQFYFKDQLPHVVADVAVPLLRWDVVAPLRRNDGIFVDTRAVAGVATAKAPFGPWDIRAGEEM